MPLLAAPRPQDVFQLFLFFRGNFARTRCSSGHGLALLFVRGCRGTFLRNRVCHGALTARPFESLQFRFHKKYRPQRDQRRAITQEQEHFRNAPTPLFLATTRCPSRRFSCCHTIHLPTIYDHSSAVTASHPLRRGQLSTPLYHWSPSDWSRRLRAAKKNHNWAVGP